MGTIYFNGAMATGCSDEWSAAAKNFVALNRDGAFADLIAGPVTATNGFTTVAILPCGSKLGWDTYENHLALIADLKALASEVVNRWGLPLADFAEFSWGHEKETGPWIESNVNPEREWPHSGPKP